MPIYKITDSKGRTRYRVHVDMGRTLDGQRNRRTKVSSTEREAKRAETVLLVERSGLSVKSNRITLRDFIEQYYLPVKEAAFRSNTIFGYKRDIRYMMPIIGDRWISDIDRFMIQLMLSSCPTKKVAENTRATLRATLNEAVQMDLLSKNPAADRFKMPQAKLGRGASGSLPWVTSFSDHRCLIDAARADGDTEAERLLVLGLCFSLRKGEILGLDWQGVSINDNIIKIAQTYTRIGGVNELTPPLEDRCLYQGDAYHAVRCRIFEAE